MTTRYYFTNAPANYDYRVCTTELLNLGHGLPPSERWRLVAISDENGGSFHEGQVPRYQSGMHAVWEPVRPVEGTTRWYLSGGLPVCVTVPLDADEYRCVVCDLDGAHAYDVTLQSPAFLRVAIDSDEAMRDAARGALAFAAADEDCKVELSLADCDETGFALQALHGEQTLAEAITEVLGAHESCCLDDAEDRDRVLQALLLKLG